MPANDSANAKLEQQRTTKPGAAVELQHRITSPVALAQPVAVELDISSSSVTADVRVQLQVDDNLSLLSDRNEWQLTLGAGKTPATLPVNVALQSGERGYIHVFVVMTTPDGDRTRSFAVPVRLPKAASDKALQKSAQEQPGIIEMPAEEKIYKQD
ncbi:MAG: hypothetical protein ACR2P1_22325 [Pseudomonadales bacterium]